MDMDGRAMNNTVYVLLLCGLPGSGKSTLARSLKEHALSHFDRVVHIEYDSVAREIQRVSSSTNYGSDFNEESLEAWRSSRMVALERFQDELRSHVSKRTNKDSFVIMDDNFHLRSMRKQIHRICSLYEGRVSFCIAWIDVSLDECLRRNRQRSTPVPDETIESMQIEQPNPEKAAWERACIRLDCLSSIDSETLLQRIIQASQPALPPSPPDDPTVLDEERRKTRESLLHQYDTRLRTWVGAVARIRRSDVGKANEARKEILQQLRSKSENQTPTEVRDWYVERVVTPEWTDEDKSQLKTVMES